MTGVQTCALPICFRQNYLQQLLSNGHLATLALDATPDNMVTEELAKRLLQQAEVQGVVLIKQGMPRRALTLAMPPKVDVTCDLDTETGLEMIWDAIGSLSRSDNRVLRIIGTSPKEPLVHLEVLVHEQPMRVAMLAYGERILLLSLVISAITAAMLYFTLRWMMVRPLQRVAASMTLFRRRPEAKDAVLIPERRNDEIGTVERELADMQYAVRSALRQKTNLATLGTAVAKINHDLRNMLTTAQLLSDYLASSDDPKVRKVAPNLMGAIDRAAQLCADTLNFTTEQPPPHRRRFAVGGLVEEVAQALRPPGDVPAAGPDLVADVAADLEVNADRDQLYRVLINVCRNAFQAGASRVSLRATRQDGATIVDIADNGPGLPPRATENLFTPFLGGARPGGAGLGLAIARDLMRGHGGEAVLVRTGPDGTVFRLVLPAIG